MRIKAYNAFWHRHLRGSIQSSVQIIKQSYSNTSHITWQKPFRNILRRKQSYLHITCLAKGPQRKKCEEDKSSYFNIKCGKHLGSRRDHSWQALSRSPSHFPAHIFIVTVLIGALSAQRHSNYQTHLQSHQPWQWTTTRYIPELTWQYLDDWQTSKKLQSSVASFAGQKY